MNLLLQIFKQIDRKDQINFFFLIIVIFFSMFLEMLSIGIIIPIITIILDTGELSYFKQFALFDNFFNKSKQDQLIIIIVIFFIIYLFKSIYITFMTIFLNSFCYNLKAKLSEKLFKNYLNKDYKFYIDHNSSIILRNIKDEPDLFVINVLKPSLLVIVDSLLLFGVVLVLLIYQPVLSTIAISLFFIVSIIFLKITNKKIRTYGEIRQDNDGLRIKKINQAVNSIIEIILMNLRSFNINEYKAPNDKSAYSTKWSVIFQELPRVWLEMAGIAGLTLIVYYLYFLDKSTNQIIPVIGLFSLAAFKSLPTINRLLASTTSIKFGLPLIKVISKNLTKIKKKNKNKSIIFKKNILFKNVYFKFDIDNHEKEIFRNINFKIIKNSSNVIIGESGSGKTTLLNLIIGFFRPTSGNIFIDGKNIKNIRDEWVNSIGYVSQVTNIIDDSLLKNIAFGIEEKKININQVENVIEKTRLGEFVKQLPNGLNTMLGERGIKISGGQRQRITIARALYNNPSILIFDEATNALDIRTESLIIDDILRLKEEKTIIFVTHRINNLNKFDNLIKINQKRINQKKNKI